MKRRLDLSILMGVIVGVAVLVVFFRAIHGEFLNWDDDRNFLSNESYRGLALSNWAWAWNTYHLGVWQPLAWVLFGVQFVAGGMSPRFYHEFSVMFHALNGALIYFLIVTCISIRRGRGEPLAESRGSLKAAEHLIALFAALVFSLHPLRVEAVAWVSCQPYLPCAFFVIVGAMVHLKSYDPARRRPDDRRVIDGFAWIATFICFGFAILFKAPAVTFPIVLLVLDLFPLDRVRRGVPGVMKRGAVLVLEKLPYFVVAFYASRFAMEAKDFNESRVAFADWSAGERLAQAAYGYAFYLVKTLVPIDLSPYYAMPSEISPAQWPYSGAAGLVVLLTVASIALIRRAPGLAAAWFCYLIILAPNVGLVQISKQIAADRYAYLATIPLFAAIGVGLAALVRTARERARGRLMIGGVLGVVVLAGLSMVTMRTILYWSDSVSLWSRAVAVDPNCAHSHCQLGQALAVEAATAEGASKGMLRRAADHLRRSTELQPDFAFAFSNLGAVYLKLERFEDAEAAYLRAVSLATMFTPDELARVYAGLAITEGALGKTKEGWQYLYEAQKLGLPREQQRMIVESL